MGGVYTLEVDVIYLAVLVLCAAVSTAYCWRNKEEFWFGVNLTILVSLLLMIASAFFVQPPNQG